jgi:multiple sugar transport system permease protein
MRKTKRKLVLDALFYLVVILMVVAILFPILWTAETSLKGKQSIFASNPQWWGFPIEDNYYRPFMVEGYFRMLWNSIFTAVGSVIVTVPLAFLAAYAFSRYRIFGAPTMYFWSLTCRMGPEAAFIIPYYLMINRLGLYDNDLSLILCYSLFNLPLAIWLMKSGIDAVPRAMDEAALVDGCSIYELLRHVVLPMATPSIAAASILVFVFSWNEYLLASVLTGLGARTITVGLQAFITTIGIRWGEMAAVSMVALIPTVVMVAALQKYVVAGLTLGAVKG